MRHKKTDRAGFTIVELLIVIVVIAILAAISIVAYNGIQQRSRDSIRKQDLASLAKAISLYNIDKGNYIESAGGCGLSSSGTGWVSSPNYTRAIVDCLQDDKYIQQNVVDPSGCANNASKPSCAAPTTSAYMKINCVSGSTKFAYLLARLESSTMTKPTELSSCASNAWWEQYGMNYAVRVN